MIAPLLACASTTRTITRESATGYIHADKPTFTTVMDVQTEVAVRRPQPRREAIDSELSIRTHTKIADKNVEHHSLTGVKIPSLEPRQMC